ncbi:MAG TPA: gephyrin-like molybdotransferase Glp [Mycobacteriales bacterium]|nr:gephyrin-like molybdotransferase Glp [Mycobacteriales bacterium]
MTQALKPVDAHLQEVLSAVAPLSSLDLGLSDAHGCVLAEDVFTNFPLPPFDSAAVDGYAVRSADVRSATPDKPVVLPVVGDALPGTTTPLGVQSGLSVRIVAGAPVPAGADAVVPREWTDGGIANVAVRQPVTPGRYIRAEGGEAPSGTRLMAAGQHLGATQIGLLAAVGRDRVVVMPRPRVVVIVTGHELVEPGQLLARGQLPDANSALLTSAAEEAGAIAFRVGIVRDEVGALADTLEDQLIRADVVITAGGSPGGVSTVVREVLNRIGKVEFAHLAMQPGTAQGFGTIGPDRTPFFALPGDPVSAYISFEAFVRPALRRMIGVDPILRPIVRARLHERVTSVRGVRSYLAAWLAVENGAYTVRAMGGGNAQRIAGLASANALIVVPEDTETVEAGAPATVMMLERREP